MLGLVHDSAPSCNGNLKLVDPDQANRVLAVWKNRTDLSILGALHVLYKLDEGRAGLLEEVIVSCLALVFAERLSTRGWQKQVDQIGRESGRGKCEAMAFGRMVSSRVWVFPQAKARDLGLRRLALWVRRLSC
jgi:hypothetical protein